MDQDADEMTTREVCEKGPVCGCLGELRVRLRPMNGRPGACRDTGAAFIYVRRIDPHKPAPPFVAAAFCPFCGESYR